MAEHDTDAALVVLAMAGRREARQALIARHYPLLVSLCRRMLGDAVLAEDAAQEAAIQALLSLDRLHDPDRFGPWLAGIGLNICRRWLQHRTREAWAAEAPSRDGVASEPVDTTAGPEEQAEAAELRTRVQRAIESLPAGQQSAVMLVYIAGMSHREAATTLDVAASAIKTRLFKARRTLRQRLYDTWQEERMPTIASVNWVDFRVRDVRRVAGTSDNPTPRHSMILEEVGGKGRQAIWGIPPHAAEAIAVQMAGVELPVPPPYALTNQVLEAMGGSVREARIPRTESRVGIGELVVDGPAGERVIECRVSDAVNLALLSNLPIRYDAAWLTDDEQTDSADRLKQSTDQLYGADTKGSSDIAAEVVAQFTRATAP